jgi:hypothetical protein
MRCNVDGLFDRLTGLGALAIISVLLRELASVPDAPAYAIGQIQNATPTSAMNAPLRTSP